MELLWVELPSTQPAAMVGATGEQDPVPAIRKELPGLASTYFPGWSKTAEKAGRVSLCPPRSKV